MHNTIQDVCETMGACPALVCPLLFPLFASHLRPAEPRLGMVRFCVGKTAETNNMCCTMNAEVRISYEVVI